MLSECSVPETVTADGFPPHALGWLAWTTHAHGDSYYIGPAAVRKLRRRLQLLLDLSITTGTIVRCARTMADVITFGWCKHSRLREAARSNALSRQRFVTVCLLQIVILYGCEKWSFWGKIQIASVWKQSIQESILNWEKWWKKWTVSNLRNE